MGWQNVECVYDVKLVSYATGGIGSPLTEHNYTLVAKDAPEAFKEAELRLRASMQSSGWEFTWIKYREAKIVTTLSMKF